MTVAFCTDTGRIVRETDNAPIGKRRLIMNGVPFVVNETPFVCWDWDLQEKNPDFLRGIDARFYQYVVGSNIEHLNGEHKHRAALSIRLAYSQALETLFALLGALVQAPACPLGWLLS